MASLQNTKCWQLLAKLFYYLSISASSLTLIITSCVCLSFPPYYEDNTIIQVFFVLSSLWKSNNLLYLHSLTSMLLWVFLVEDVCSSRMECFIRSKKVIASWHSLPLVLSANIHAIIIGHGVIGPSAPCCKDILQSIHNEIWLNMLIFLIGFLFLEFFDTISVKAWNCD